MKIFTIAASASLILALSACNADTTGSENSATVETKDQPQAAFFDRLSALCGKAFTGKLVSNDEADKDMIGKAMAMHVASCSDTEIKIPFHIETETDQWNRSRTWIITKADNGLRLKHDHRHEDGSSDKITMYGGDTSADNMGSAKRQEFPVDDESIAMFKTGGLAASVTNIWAVEIDDKNYTYELSRENRLFRVTFDLSNPINKPALPWGWDTK